MKRDCPIVLNQCPQAETPILNASSEAPDPLLFWGVGWTNFDPFRPPPLGNGPYTDDVDCSNITFSTDNQALADLWAFIYAQICETPPDPVIPGVPPLPPLPEIIIPPAIGPVPAIEFGDLETKTCGNDRQEASVDCPDGSTFSMAVEANSYTATLPIAVCDAWVEYINAYLLAWILDNILSMRVCPQIPGLEERTEPGTDPDPIPPPGPGVPPPLISAHPGWCCYGASLVASQFTYTAQGGPTGAVWSFAVTGTIPPGTSLVQTGPNTAVLTGTPSAPGDYAYAVVCTYGSLTLTINDTIHVFGLTVEAVPDATANQFYSEQLVATGTSGGDVFTYSGSLPSGVTLSSEGLLSGTPTEEGTFNFTVTVTDSAGGHCDTALSLTVELACTADPGPAAPTSLLYDITPVLVDTQVITPADVAPGVSFTALPADGTYEIRYVGGWFEMTTPAGCPAGTGRATYIEGVNPVVFTSKGNTGGFFDCPSAPDPDIVTKTLAANPMVTFNESSGYVLTAWRNAGNWACCNAEDPWTNSITYDLYQTKARYPQAARLRIVEDLDDWLDSLGECAGCAAATVEPVWDGTLPYTNETLTYIAYYPNPGSDGWVNIRGKRIFVYAQFVAGQWQFIMTCSAGTVWRAHKSTGTNAVGTYLKWAFGQCVVGPDCIHFESY